MMVRPLLLLAALAACAGLAGSAYADGLPIPLLSKRDAPPPLLSPAELKADFVAKSGSDTVYFGNSGAVLDSNAIRTLTFQAQWLLANPTVLVRLEGHGGPQDTRDYALAIGEKRASAVRDFLVLHGIAPDRLTIATWGKERPGTVRVGASSVFVGPRVVSVISGSSGPAMLGSR